MSNPGTIRETIRWETVAVTALAPGWRNVYRDGDGRTYERHCPALLLQEKHGTTTVRYTQGADGKTERDISYEAAEPPYETRAVFADTDFGHLEAAVDGDGYLGTADPSQVAGDITDPVL